MEGELTSDPFDLSACRRHEAGSQHENPREWDPSHGRGTQSPIEHPNTVPTLATAGDSPLLPELTAMGLGQSQLLAANVAASNKPTVSSSSSPSGSTSAISCRSRAARRSTSSLSPAAAAAPMASR